MSRKQDELNRAFYMMLPNSRTMSTYTVRVKRIPLGQYRFAFPSKRKIDPNFKIIPRERNKPDAYKKATIELKKLGKAMKQIPPHYFKEAQ